MLCPPPAYRVVKCNLRKSDNVLSLAETFSAGNLVSAVLMLSQPEITNMEYHGKGFERFPLTFCSYVVAGPEHRQVMRLPAGGHRVVPPSITGSRKTRCPPLHPEGQAAELSSSHLLIWGWPDFLNAQMWCSLLLSEFRVLQLILVSASCAVWKFLCSWPFSVWHSCSQYKHEPRRSLSLHLQFFVTSKTARICRPHLHWSEGLCHITERVPTLEILLSKFTTKKISRRCFRDTSIFLLEQDTKQSEAVRLKRFAPIHTRNLLQSCLAFRPVQQPQALLFSFLVILCNFP